MTRNDCFTAGRKITPKGIMIHSTATPGVMAASWFSRWNKSFKAGEINRQVCVHAFVDDKEVWQYLPWNHRGWHAGGAANNTHIGIEICEPAGFSYAGGANMVGYDVARNENYFRRAWQNAVDLCVMLCRTYGLTSKNIIDHSEGHRQGIASNHADVMHWFPKHKESMNSFRAAVQSAMNSQGAWNGVHTAVGISVGDVVEVISNASSYHPGGPRIPDWVKRDSYHKVTQTNVNGRVELRGGKECVLLGRKVDKKTGQESAGIMTWIDKDLLKIIRPPKANVQPSTANVNKFYRVQVGAFAGKNNAESLLKRLKTAGFDGYIKFE